MKDDSLVDSLTIARLHELARDVAQPGEDVLGDLLATYRADLRDRLAAIETALAQDDLGAAAEAAHALKGASLTIGAAGMATELAALEHALRARAGHERLVASTASVGERTLAALADALARAR